MVEWCEKTLGNVTSFMGKGIPPKYAEHWNEHTIYVLNQKCNRNFEISYNEARLNDCTKKKVPADKMGMFLSIRREQEPRGGLHKLQISLIQRQ